MLPPGEMPARARAPFSGEGAPSPPPLTAAVFAGDGAARPAPTTPAPPPGEAAAPPAAFAGEEAAIKMRPMLPEEEDAAPALNTAPPRPSSPSRSSRSEVEGGEGTPPAAGRGARGEGSGGGCGETAGGDVVGREGTSPVTKANWAARAARNAARSIPASPKPLAAPAAAHWHPPRRPAGGGGPAAGGVRVKCRCP